MYNSIINGTSAYAYLTIGDTYIYPGSISNNPGISVTQTMCGDDGYTIGGFASSQLVVSIATAALPEVVTDKKITVYMGYETGVDADGKPVYTTVQVGEFFTTQDQIVTKGLFTSITAFDVGYYATGLYLPTGEPVAVADAINDVLNQSGLQLAPDAYSSIRMSRLTAIHRNLEGLSYRDVISHCALLLGATACITRDGKLTFRIPNTNPVKTYDQGSYSYESYSLQSNAEYSLGRLQVNWTHEVVVGEGTEDQRTEEVTETYVYQAPNTSSTRGIIIDTDDIRTQAETDTLGRALFGTDGFSLYGYDLRVGGRPEIDLGDSIVLEDDTGTTRNLFVLGHTITYNGALMSDFSARVPIAESTSLTTKQRATLSDQVLQLSGLTTKINRLMADLVVATEAKFESVETELLTTSNLIAGKADIDLLNVDQAKISQLIADNIDTEAITAGVIESDKLRTAYAHITNGKIDNATIDHADVEGLSANYASVSMLEANYVTTDKLESNYAKIEDLESDSASIGTIATSHLSVGDIVAQGLQTNTAEIKEAVVMNLDVNSINGNVIRNSAVLAKALSNEMVETLSGSRVYYSPEAPETATAGDVWYKTVTDEQSYQDDNPYVEHVYYFDGGTWKIMPDVGNIFRANSITAQEIAANTITASNINMDNLQTNMAYFGDKNSVHIEIDGAKGELDFMNGTRVVAYINGQQMLIPYTVVLNEMLVGQAKDIAGNVTKTGLWAWNVRDNQHLQLKWIGGN